MSKSQVQIAQQLSLISIGQLNSALVETGYASEVSSDKSHVVRVLIPIIDKGGISLDQIVNLRPMATAEVNSRTNVSSALPADVKDAVQQANAGVANALDKVDKVRQACVALIDQARDDRVALKKEVSDIGLAVAKSFDDAVKQVQGVDYNKVDSEINKRLVALFDSFKQTATPTQLQVVANALPHFELKSAKDVFPAPLSYEDDGEYVNFEDFQVGVWNDPSAPTRIDDYVFNPKHLHQTLCALDGSLPDNVWLAGERGTGKTEFVNQVASRLGRRLFRINFDEAMERAEFIGGNTIQNGNVEWKAGVITQAIQHTGALVLLDEIGFARAQNLASLHALCEPSPHRSIVIAETGTRIPVAPYVAFFCADNSNGHGDASGNFAGVRDQNSAFIDRFSYTLTFEYLPHDAEVALVSSRTGLNCNVAEILITFANVAREKARAGVLTQPPSLRQLFAWARAVKKGVPVGVAFQNAIINKFPADCESELRGVFVATVNVANLKKYLTK